MNPYKFLIAMAVVIIITMAIVLHIVSETTDEIKRVTSELFDGGDREKLALGAANNLRRLAWKSTLIISTLFGALYMFLR